MPQDNRHGFGRKPRYKEHHASGHTPALARDDFLVCEKARALTIEGVSSLDNDEIYDVFMAIRWHRTGGEPECPHCESLAVYTYRARTIYRCQNCKRQFSSTTGTTLSWHKLPYRAILLAVAIFFNGTTGVNALILHRHIRAQYKPALDLARKLRWAMVEKIIEDLPDIDFDARPQPPDPALSSPLIAGVNGTFPKRDDKYTPQDQILINQGHYWHSSDIEFLRNYWGKGANSAWLAEKLMRTESTVSYKARDLQIIRPLFVRRARKLAPPPLQFPYINTSPTDEHQLLLSVNELVPRGFSSEMRADICQEALLAILNGDITLDELRQKNRMSWYIKKFYKDNFNPYGTLSLDGIQEDQERSWEDSVARTDEEGRITRQSGWMNTYQNSTQIEDVYGSEILGFQARQFGQGVPLSFAETEKEVESGELDWNSGALVRAKRAAHASLDRMWLPEGDDRAQSYISGSQGCWLIRDKVYAWISQELGIRRQDAHIGNFDLATCHRVVELCELRNLNGKQEVGAAPNTNAQT